MHKLWVIARKDILEALHSRSTYIYMIILLMLTLFYFDNSGSILTSLMNSGKTSAELADFSRVYLSSITYSMPLWLAVLMCTIFSAYAVVIDKSKRSLESLMAAPVSLKQIWAGKSLGVALPSVVVSLVISVISYVALNVVKVVPAAGSFILPDVMALVSAFILVPLLILVVVALVIYIQMVISNPRMANFIFTGFFIVIFFSSSFLVGKGVNLNFAVIYLGIIIICSGLVLILSRSLTRERVLLSNKN